MKIKKLKTMRFVVELTVDETHEGAPEPDEVILQIERALLDDSYAGPGFVLSEFGIHSAKATYEGDCQAGGPVYDHLVTIVIHLEEVLQSMRHANGMLAAVRDGLRRELQELSQ